MKNDERWKASMAIHIIQSLIIGMLLIAILFATKPSDVKETVLEKTDLLEQRIREIVEVEAPYVDDREYILDTLDELKKASQTDR